MKTVCALILLVATLCAPGCGGGGGGANGSGNPLFSRYQSLLNDVEDEDLDDTMSNYSFDFFHDCTDYDEAEADWDDLFSEPGVSTDISDLNFSFWDTDGNEGYAEGSFHVRTDDNGNITNEDVDFAMYFRREDGVWLLYGNQDCVIPPNGDAQKTKLKLSDLLGRRNR